MRFFTTTLLSLSLLTTQTQATEVIDISDLDEAEVLRALWKNAPFAIPAFAVENCDLPLEEAQEILESGKPLHLVRGRVLFNITFEDNGQLSNVEKYNRKNVTREAKWAKGQGFTAHQIIEKLRTAE